MLNQASPMTFIPTTQPEEARRFYEGVLGLKLIAEELPFALVFDSAGTMLRVVIVDSFTPQPFTVLGWIVDDIAQSIDELAAKGVAFVRYPDFDQDERGVLTFPDDTALAWFRDPDGNLLSLTQFAD